MASFPFWLQSTLEQPIYDFPPFTDYDFDSGVGEPKLAPYQKSHLAPPPSSVFRADDEELNTLEERTRQEWVQHAKQNRATYLAGVKEEAKRWRHFERCVRKAFKGGEGAGAGGEQGESVLAALDMNALLELEEEEEEEGTGVAPRLPSPPLFPACASLSPLSLVPPPPPPTPSFDIVEDATAEPPPKRARTASRNILSSSAAAGNPRLRLPSPPPFPWSQVPMELAVPEHANCPGPMNMPSPPLPSSQPAVKQWQQWPEWQQFPAPEPMPQAAGPGWFGNSLSEWQARWLCPAGPSPSFGGWGASSTQVQMPAAPTAAPASSAPPPPHPFLPVTTEQAQVQGAAPGPAPQFQPSRKRGQQNKPRATGQGRRNDLY